MKSEHDDVRGGAGDFQRFADADEISLVDLWLVLARRKWVIIGVFFVVLGLGGVFAFLKPQSYRYSTPIEIGTNLVQTKDTGLQPQMIEPPGVVQAKLEKVFIPLALRRYRDKHPEGFLPEIKVTLPQDGAKSGSTDSQIVLLESRGPLARQDVIKNLQNEVVEELVDDHKKMLVFPRQQYAVVLAQETLQLNALEDPQIFAVQLKEQERKIDQAKIGLANLKDQARVLTVEKKGLAEKQRLYEKQIKDLNATLAQARGRHPAAEKEVTDEAKALTFLMVNNQLESTRSRLADLEEKLYVDLQNQSDRLESQIANNQRQQQAQVRSVDELQSALVKVKLDHQQRQASQIQTLRATQDRIDALKNTHAMDVAMQSLKPVGAGKGVIVALAGVLGLFLGLFAALFAEFLQKVREQHDAA